MARKKSEKNILETLSKHIRRTEKFYEATAEQDIIFSKECKISVLKEDMGILKDPIPWPLYNSKMFYIVTVPPGTTVPAHEHDEDVFRLVTKGSLTINDKTVKKGEWFVVKSGTEYKVKTKRGYTVLSIYTSKCRTYKGFRSKLGSKAQRA